MNEDLYNVLKRLALSVKEVIDDGISKGTIKPDEEVFLRWKIDKFQYTDEGATEVSRHHEYITKPSWLRTTFMLTESIKKSNEIYFCFRTFNYCF